MIWTTAGRNRICARCMELKDTVVGHTDESGVKLPPLHPRCRCTIMYREIEPPKPPGDETAIRTKPETEMSELKLKGRLVYPPPVMDLSEYVFDAAHTQGDEHPHDVTEDEARKFIAEACFAIVKYNGDSVNFFSKEGASYVRRDIQTIRTAFKSKEYDEKIRKLMKCSRMKIEIYKQKVWCPVLKSEIGDMNCDDAANVAESFHPERFAPKEIRAVPNWKEICRSCKNNPYNEN